MIILPKGNGKFRGIRLAAILWKALSGVINRKIRAALKFHDVLHGFRARPGTGTAYLEYKLL